MAQVNQMQIELVSRQNKNSKSLAFGKYYLEVRNKEPLSTRGLIDHIMSHGLGFTRPVIEACLTQISQCLVELLVQGQPVKLDGFGTFKLNAFGRGATEAQVIDEENAYNVMEYIKGLKLVVIPEGCEEDNLTSRANLHKVSINYTGIVESVEIGETAKGNARKATAFTPLKIWTDAHPRQ